MMSTFHSSASSRLVQQCRYISQSIQVQQCRYNNNPETIKFRDQRHHKTLTMEWTDSSNPLPLSNLTPSSGVIDLLQEYQVTEEDKKSFWEKGYWKGPVVLDQKGVQALSNEFERIFQGQIDTNGAAAVPYEYRRWKDMVTVQAKDKTNCALRKINNGWWINESVKSVVTSPVIGKMAANLLGVNEIKLWHDSVIYKPGQGSSANNQDDADTTDESSSEIQQRRQRQHPTHPTSCGSVDQLGNVGWHQDYAFWRCSDNSDMITAFLVLQDTSDINGTLHTVVGSHKWGLQKDAATFFQVDNDALKERFEAEAEKIGSTWQDEEAVLKAGQIIFHHALTFHGSGPNYTESPRKALAIHLQPGGTKYQGTSGGWHQNISDLGPNPKPGQLFEGSTWPVLWAKKE